MFCSCLCFQNHNSPRVILTQDGRHSYQEREIIQSDLQKVVVAEIRLLAKYPEPLDRI